jgi:hypothetical protein
MTMTRLSSQSLALLISWHNVCTANQQRQCNGKIGKAMDAIDFDPITGESIYEADPEMPEWSIDIFEVFDREDIYPQVTDCRF